MLSVANFESNSDDKNLALIRKRIRDSSNPLELPHLRFVSLYRISKDAFKYLLDEISPEFKPLVKSSSIPPILKNCAALRFFAEGSYQQSSGQDITIGMYQASISESLKEVLNILEQTICPKWISFELTEPQKEVSKGYFYRTTGFPGVIGCVDGTHINNIAPTSNEHIFFNIKGYHSLNGMVCDHKMKIKSVDEIYEGSSHDFLVWECSDQRLYLQQKRTEGDSCYPLEPWIITPFRSEVEGSPESRFNPNHSKARNIVERTIGNARNFKALIHKGNNSM